MTAQSPIRADLAGDARHFPGKGVELVYHCVNRLLELQDLAADVHGDLLRKIAVGNGRGDFRDVAHLRRQVVGHGVDAVGEILPGAGHTDDVGLAAQPAFGADFASHTRHFTGESVELVHHRVDRFL